MAARCGSNAQSTRYGLRDVEFVVPASAGDEIQRSPTSKETVALGHVRQGVSTTRPTSTCSSSWRSRNQEANSSIPSTCQATIQLCHETHYASRVIAGADRSTATTDRSREVDRRALSIFVDFKPIPFRGAFSFRPRLLCETNPRLVDFIGPKCATGLTTDCVAIWMQRRAPSIHRIAFATDEVSVSY